MDGILPLWKPAGMTSHDCVFKIRKMLKMKKVGHTGTLDPDVTGVLPICLGRATKVAEYVTNTGKEYIGEVTVGCSTTTEDSSGEIVEEKKVQKTFTRNEILAVLAQLTGEIKQTPPMYSAVKVNGKRLYEYARQGLEIKRPSRNVTIYELELLDDRENFDGPLLSFRFRARCSKGTYIRTLAVMMGEILGYPAHMSFLCRTASGSLTQSQCITFEELEKHVLNHTVENIVLPLETGISHLPTIEINDTLAVRVKNGAVLVKEDLPWPENAQEAVFFHSQKALAIYKVHPEKPYLVKPNKILLV
ncbi:tRNA pseudouridine(55) synthase TruB [Heyndrickxia acidicola]|uniref:tRNA pseudouridine synthase B n=1 Tax=Heyndrickxia acidicola TaxID=209389 RepID=A0ABU6MBH0_9BACI|nr:tRNA pseudouridine(55) synthase TruB [Heyndrickxia acidicola]MED1202030.1 tRNA pseudouridine(55) synthase TruB [Heyndrickxia acidicola]